MITGDNLAGERKPVAILFTDIVGSTSIAEKLDPEEWKEIVSGAHRIVGEAVRRYEGTVAQPLGDGVLAFFGAPVTDEDDPNVLCGLLWISSTLSGPPPPQWQARSTTSKCASGFTPARWWWVYWGMGSTWNTWLWEML